MKKTIGMVMGLLFLGAAQAEPVGPEQLIRDTADQVLAAIKTNAAQYRESPDKLYALVDQVVLPHFDFDAMTDLALGRHKDEIDAIHKPLVTSEFRALLVRTYGKALLEYNDQTIRFLPMEGAEADGEVIVKSEVEQQGGFPIPLDYRLRQTDQGWKVFDISVDGISLVTNYRSSFARQIKKNGVEGLIKLLRERNQEE